MSLLVNNNLFAENLFLYFYAAKKINKRVICLILKFKKSHLMNNEYCNKSVIFFLNA